jgi:hypothetical protein
MESQRAVKIIEDQQGRKLVVEVTGDAPVVGAVAPIDNLDLFRPVGAEGKIKKFTNTLSDLISDTTSAIMDGIEKVAHPSKVQVEFGIELGAEGEVWFIAKGSVSSTIKVSIEWERLKDSAHGGQDLPSKD